MGAIGPRQSDGSIRRPEKNARCQKRHQQDSECGSRPSDRRSNPVELVWIIASFGSPHPQHVPELEVGGSDSDGKSTSKCIAARHRCSRSVGQGDVCRPQPFEPNTRTSRSKPGAPAPLADVDLLRVNAGVPREASIRTGWSTRSRPHRRTTATCSADATPGTNRVLVADGNAHAKRSATVPELLPRQAVPPALVRIAAAERRLRIPRAPRSTHRTTDPCQELRARVHCRRDASTRSRARRSAPGSRPPARNPGGVRPRRPTS